MADVGNHPGSTQAGYPEPSPLSDLAQSIVSRFRGPRSMLSPWIQRTMADQPASTETGEPHQISLSGRHTDRLLNKVQRQTAESQVWQPNIGSLKPDFVDRFATNIVERFPATDTKYAAQPLTSASNEPANLVLVGDPAQPVSTLEEPGAQPQSSSSDTENWPTLADLQRAVEAKANWTPSSPAPSLPPSPVQRTPARPAQPSQPASPSPASPPRPRRIFSRVEEVTPSGTTSVRTRSSGQEEPLESESVQKKEDTAQIGVDDSLAETKEAETPPSEPSGPETSPVVQRQPDQSRPTPKSGPGVQPEVRSAPDKSEAQTPPTLQPTDQPLPPDRSAGSSVQRQPDQPEPPRRAGRSQVEEIGVVRAEDLPSSITDPDQPGPAVEPDSEASQAVDAPTSPPVQAEPPLSATTRPEREVTMSEPRQMAAESPPQSVQRQPDGEAEADRPEIVSRTDRGTEPASRTSGEEAAAGPPEEISSGRTAGKSSPQTVQRQVEQEPITSKQPEVPESERLPSVSRTEQSEPPLEDEAGGVPAKEAPSSRQSPETPPRQAAPRQPEPDVPPVQPEEISSGQPEPDVPSVQPAEIKPGRPELSSPGSEGDQPEASVDEAEVFDRVEEPTSSRQSEPPPTQAVQRQPEPDVSSVQSGFVRSERPTGEVDQPGHRPTEQLSSPGVQRQTEGRASPQPPVVDAEEYGESPGSERPAPAAEDRPESESPQSEAGPAPAVQRHADRAESDQFEAVRPQVEEMEDVQQPPAQAEARWPEVEEPESPPQPEAPALSETGPMSSDSDSFDEASPLAEAAPDVSQRVETAPGVQRQLDSDLPVETEPSSPVSPTGPEPLPAPPRSEVEPGQVRPSVDEDVLPSQLETFTQEPGRETQPTSSKVQRQLEPDPTAPIPSPSPESERPPITDGETVSPESPAPPASEQEPAASSSIEAGDLPAESPAQSHPSESPVQRQSDEPGTSRPGLEEDILARASSKANLPLAKPMSAASRFKSGSDPSRNGAQSGSPPSSQGQVQARFENGSAGQPESTPLVLNRFRPPAPQGTISEVGASESRSGGIQRAVTDPFPAPRDLPLPPVYRAAATDQSAEVVQRSDETSETGTVTGAEAGASEQDLDKLAREVYPIIKRLLAVERERDTGLLRRR